MLLNQKATVLTKVCNPVISPTFYTPSVEITDARFSRRQRAADAQGSIRNVVQKVRYIMVLPVNFDKNLKFLWSPNISLLSTGV